MIKPKAVKIIQITSCVDPVTGYKDPGVIYVFGLGDDGKVYIWGNSVRGLGWELYEEYENRG